MKKNGPYREPEKPKKKCDDPFKNGCVRDASVIFRAWTLCSECYIKITNDAGMMG